MHPGQYRQSIERTRSKFCLIVHRKHRKIYFGVRRIFCQSSSEYCSTSLIFRFDIYQKSLNHTAVIIRTCFDKISIRILKKSEGAVKFCEELSQSWEFGRILIIFLISACQGRVRGRFERNLSKIINRGIENNHELVFKRGPRKAKFKVKIFTQQIRFHGFSFYIHVHKCIHRSQSSVRSSRAQPVSEWGRDEFSDFARGCTISKILFNLRRAYRLLQYVRNYWTWCFVSTKPGCDLPNF